MNKTTEKLFLELLSNLPNSSVIENGLTAFSLLKGRKFNKKLLVIGRAVNGWVINWEKSQSHKKASQIINELKNREKQFLDWPYNNEGNTNGYNPNRSAFWRVVRKIVLQNKISPNYENWSNYIAWTNLYKISNWEGGNPSSSLRNFQFNNVKTILLNDITDCNPLNVLFLTGEGWALPFIEDIFKPISKKLNYIHKVGNLNLKDKNFNCIIAPHPQGKKEDPIVNEILQNIY